MLPATPEAAARARETLPRGGVVAFPTETVYGLGALYGDAAAAQRLRAIKGRDAAKPFQVLVAGVAAAERLARLTPAARRVLETFWPGPLTLVLPALADGAGGANSADARPATIGLRAPDHPWLQSLLQTLPTGLTATSANLAGEPPATDAAAALAALGGQVDLFIDGGPSAIGQASTVAALVEGELKILRPGSITETALRQALAEG